MKLLKKLMKPFQSKIKTDDEYRERMVVFEALMEKGEDLTTAEADYMELLGELLEDYEHTHTAGLEDFLATDFTPIDAIRWAMDRHGLKQKELCPYIGSQQLVSAVMNGARPLSKTMIVKLHEGLDIPYDYLMPKSVAKSYRKVAMF